jgi:hypothetical protein
LGSGKVLTDEPVTPINPWGRHPANHLEKISPCGFYVNSDHSRCGAYQSNFTTTREVNDRWSEATLSGNISTLLDALGRTAEAVSYLEQCVALDEAIGHPDLESDRSELERVRGELGNG